MEEDKSAIEILKDFALNTGRKIEFSEKHYPTRISHRGFSHVSHAIVSDKLNQNEYFVSYSDSRGFGDNANYSGFFFLMDAPAASTIKIRKKNVLDKLNPFFKQNRFSSRYSEFNTKVVIEENDIALTNRIFSNTLTQELTREILNLDDRIRVGVNNINVDIVPVLKGKSTFGIYLAGEWLLNETILEKLFRFTINTKLRFNV